MANGNGAVGAAIGVGGAITGILIGWLLSKQAAAEAAPPAVPPTVQIETDEYEYVDGIKDVVQYIDTPIHVTTMDLELTPRLIDTLGVFDKGYLSAYYLKRSILNGFEFNQAIYFKQQTVYKDTHIEFENIPINCETFAGFGVKVYVLDTDLAQKNTQMDYLEVTIRRVVA